jgi:hypothetical protein
MPIVVIVLEDDPREMKEYELAFFQSGYNDLFTIVFAVTLVEAKRAYLANRGASFVVIDGIVPQYADGRVGFYSPDFVHYLIHRNFSGVMIAASSKLEYNQKLEAAGCHYSCEKDDVVSLIIRLAKEKGLIPTT